MALDISVDEKLLKMKDFSLYPCLVKYEYYISRYGE